MQFFNDVSKTDEIPFASSLRQGGGRNPRDNILKTWTNETKLCGRIPLEVSDLMLVNQSVSLSVTERCGSQRVRGL